jgi:hypothetical protein
MPIMLGFSAPTFGLLKTLSFEVEMLANPNIESNAGIVERLDESLDADYRYLVYDKDNTKGSLFVLRGITTSLSIRLQVENDPMRLYDFKAWLESMPATNQGQHGYWLARIQ